MFRKVIGAVVGAEAAKHTSKIGGPAGSLIGAVAVPMILRMSLPAIAVIGGGAYLAKRLYDRRRKSADPPALG